MGFSKQIVALLTVAVFSPEFIFGSDILDPKYNKLVRPSEGIKTDVVEFGVSIISIRSVSEEDMTVTIDAYIRASWTDERLIFSYNNLYREIFSSSPDECRSETCSNYVANLGSDFADLIWKPDFEFAGATSIQPIDEYNDNVYVRLNSDGGVHWSRRFLISFSCPMKMSHFPFDQHKCSLQIQSYKYHNGLVQQKFLSSMTRAFSEQRTSNFVFKDFDFEKDHQTLSATFSTGSYTMDSLQFEMTRKYGLFYTQLFLPSLSLTVLGWVTLWINPKRVPERATISITVILAQVVLIVGVAQQYPAVSDLKMADVYVIVNFIFNFVGLIENILAANFGVKHYKEDKVKSLVDSVFSVFFPLTFGIWNILFFGYNILRLK